MRSVSLSFRCITLAILLATTAALTGCNLKDNNVSSGTDPVSYPLGAISGVVHGGAPPVVGAKVQIWATQNNGYGGAGLLMAEANSVDGTQGDGDDTDSGGNFLFSAANYTTGCPAGQQAYITVTGGNTGAGTNSNLLLMAALGSCASLYGSTASSASSVYGTSNPTIWIDEVTTATAAYALANFITISGTSAPFTVNISSPVANNYSDGAFAWNGTAYAACSGTACNGYASFSAGVETTYANGLAHAFSNAVNMVNIASGQLYPYIVNGTGTSTTPTAGYGVVPRATLNTVANALQTCVNSKSSSSSLSTNCSTLFNAAPNSAGIVPTNTLQAAVNLAKNPYSNATNVAAVASLVTAQTSVYGPYLSSGPPDWSASIVYKGGGINTPYNLALDANDNVYTNSTGGSPSVLVALSSSGKFLYGSSGVNAVNSAGTGLTSLRGLAADANGFIYSADDVVGNTSSSLAGTYQFLASTGAYNGVLTHANGSPSTTADPISYPLSVAVTRRNDVWTTYGLYGIGNIDWWQCTGSPCTYAAASTTGNVVTSQTTLIGAFSDISASSGYTPWGVAVDGNQNVWAAVQGGNIVATFVNNYANAQATYPAYDNSTGAGSSSPYTHPKILSTDCGSYSAPYTLTFDSANAAWATLTTSAPSSTATTPSSYLCSFTPNAAVVTSVTPGTAVSLGTGYAEGLAMDGNNVAWIPMFSYDNSSTGYANLGVQAYNTATASFVSAPTGGFTSCYVSATATGASTCTAGSTTAAVTALLAISNPRQAAVDSSGDLWLDEPDDDTITETLGIAAPTWPLLSAAKFGVKPQ